MAIAKVVVVAHRVEVVVKLPSDKRGSVGVVRWYRDASRGSVRKHIYYWAAGAAEEVRTVSEGACSVWDLGRVRRTGTPPRQKLSGRRHGVAWRKPGRARVPRPARNVDHSSDAATSPHSS